MDDSKANTLEVKAEELLQSTKGRRALAQTKVVLKAWTKTYRETGLVPILPLMFKIRGKPYSLTGHFPMKPMFKVHEVPRKSIFKCGRQVGKTNAFCSSGKVYLSNGRPIMGNTISVGDKVCSYDEQSGKMVTGTVSYVHPKYRKECLKIRTRMGVEHTVGVTHPFLTGAGWVEAGELSVGTSLATARRSGVFVGVKQPIERVILTALILGDGHCSHQSTGFTAVPGEASRSFVLANAALSDEVTVYDKKGTRACDYRVKKSSQLRSWLLEDDLVGKRSWEKSIPAWVYDLPVGQSVDFVRHIWSTDGSVKARLNGYSITYCSTSRSLAYGLRSLLLKHGVLTNIRNKSTSFTVPSGGKKEGRTAYEIRVEGRESQERFINLFEVPDKKMKIIPGLPPERSNRDTLPIEANDIVYRLANKVAYDRAGKTLRQAGLRRKPKHRLSKSKAQQYVDFFTERGIDCSELSLLCESEVAWDEVVFIEKVGEQDCWDIEVAEHHNYLVDGLVTHNSTVIAYQGASRSLLTPFFNSIFLCPLYEQIRRFSNNYMKYAVNSCTFYHRVKDWGVAENVLQRSFNNGSNMFFTFAFRDAERVRGINADAISIDEIQGMDKSFFPLILETMSASPYRFAQFSGTPLSMDNGIEEQWQLSSRAEWAIKCDGCGHTNVASAEADLMKMLGKEGLICSKCGKPLVTQKGYWLHTVPSRRRTYTGYHVPQAILPMHCQNRAKWIELLDKREQFDEFSFMTEVLGESCDSGAKLVTTTDLRDCCKLEWNNQFESAKSAFHPNKYTQRVLAIDWSGGGADEESLTAMAVLGLRPDGRIEVIWMKKYRHTTDYYMEALRAVRLFKEFECSHIAHDFGGAGAAREQILMHSNMIPPEKIVPITLVRAHTQAAAMTYNEPTEKNVRHSWSLDKARSLLASCELIKSEYILFPKWDTAEPCVKDWLALTEETTKTPRGSDMYLIGKAQGVPDDCAQAVNLGIHTLYHLAGKFPNIAETKRVRKALEAIRELSSNNFIQGSPSGIENLRSMVPIE